MIELKAIRVSRLRVLAVVGTLACGVFWSTACGPEGPPREVGSEGAVAIPEAPLPPPTEWVPLVGEYATGTDTLSLLEDEQNLYVLFWKGGGQALRPASDSTFELTGNGGILTVRREGGGKVEGLALGNRTFQRLSLGGAEGETFQITPLRPPAELRAEALASLPPVEEGDFLPADLVEVVNLNPTIRLDVRYASTNNFMGEVFYSSPRAFLQRPAAEAVVRAHEWLRERGYGLLIHDGYRPWYVTKMFWDATPEALRNFVADPASGSRHNRGCAVDLTLYDLETGDVVMMPAGYDEMSPRSHADFPGGTTRQRWYRKLLRDALEAQGFQVYPDEWWHFDYEDWSRYRIGNEVFEEIGLG
ncbi:MAG: M15 family metallopeptidase [Gemmatimonadota bacterium]